MSRVGQVWMEFKPGRHPYEPYIFMVLEELDMGAARLLILHVDDSYGRPGDVTVCADGFFKQGWRLA